jgi:hypothetical protein
MGSGALVSHPARFMRLVVRFVWLGCVVSGEVHAAGFMWLRVRWRMPNALTLGYQKSRIRHTPSHLRPPEGATGSFVKVGVFNTRSFVKDCVLNTGSFPSATMPARTDHSPSPPSGGGVWF